MHFCIFWHFLPTHIFWAQDRIIRILWWMWHCGTVKFLQPKLHWQSPNSAWRTLAASAALPQRSADTWAAQKRSPIFNMCCTETEAARERDMMRHSCLSCVNMRYLSVYFMFGSLSTDWANPASDNHGPYSTGTKPHTAGTRRPGRSWLRHCTQAFGACSSHSIEHI